jgi:hypothetical protein
METKPTTPEDAVITVLVSTLGDALEVISDLCFYRDAEQDEDVQAAIKHITEIYNEYASPDAEA